MSQKSSLPQSKICLRGAEPGHDTPTLELFRERIEGGRIRVTYADKVIAENVEQLADKDAATWLRANGFHGGEIAHIHEGDGVIRKMVEELGGR